MKESRRDESPSSHERRGDESPSSLDTLFGHGVVGKATCKAFGIDFWVDWDKKNGRYSTASGCHLLKDVKDARYIWICVPTPSIPEAISNLRECDRGGLVPKACDTSIVESVIRDFAAQSRMGEAQTFVVRSTVIPGTAKRLMDKYNVDIISFPEFLSERTAEEDAAHPWLTVIGGRSVDKFIHDHAKHFAGGPWRGYHRFDDNATAEMVKYAVNCLFATLTIFGNQIFDACEKAGVQYDDIKSVLEKMPWREHHHLDPLKDGYRGYAGKCIPKDVRAMIAEYDLLLLRVVDTINEKLLGRDGITCSEMTACPNCKGKGVMGSNSGPCETAWGILNTTDLCPTCKGRKMVPVGS
jgi:UDP-glucose 6-dehydrogenase